MTNPRETGQTKDAFLAQVIDTAPGIDSSAEAEQVSREVLTALANAVSFGQVAALMEALPPGLAPEGTAVAGNARPVDKAAFLEQIGGVTGSTDSAIVEQHVRAVLTTVAKWVPEAQVSDTLEQLPRELRELFDPPQD